MNKIGLARLAAAVIGGVIFAHVADAARLVTERFENKRRITWVQAEEIANQVVAEVHHFTEPVFARGEGERLIVPSKHFGKTVYAMKAMFSQEDWTWSVIYHSMPVVPGCQQFYVVVDARTGASQIIEANRLT